MTVCHVDDTGNVRSGTVKPCVAFNFPCVPGGGTNVGTVLITVKVRKMCFKKYRNTAFSGRS